MIEGFKKRIISKIPKLKKNIKNRDRILKHLKIISASSFLKNGIRKMLRRFIFKVSPTFRMLSGNRHRMNLLLDKIENLEKLSKQRDNILLDKIEKINEQRDNILLDKIEKINEQKNEILIAQELKIERLSQQSINRNNLLNISIKNIEIKHNKKRILFVAMLDSIHTARWLSQFNDSKKYEVHLFPVSFGKIHDLILNESTFIIHEYIFPKKNWTDAQYTPSEAIEDVINFIKPDIVHTLEMQHAAYLVLPIKKKMGSRFPIWFYSCWGSDIKWFEKFPEHKSKIIEVLNNCDALFSGDRESIRKAIDDYGFNKATLNVPSPGGYRVDYYTDKIKFIPPSERKIILVKGYTGWVYKSEVILEALKRCKEQLQDHKMKVVIFLSGDIQDSIEELKKVGVEVEIFAHTDDYDDVMNLYSRAKISLASSLSDGVPNSMLESMLMGCFPIVSNSGSTSEFIDTGINGILLEPEDINGYASAIKKALSDSYLMENAAKMNKEMIKDRLDYDMIKEKVLSFYARFI